MINLLLLLFFLTCVGLTASWIAENPGSVTIYWFDWRIDTSFAFLLVLAVVTAFTLAYLYILLRHIALAPEYFSRQRRISHYKKGLNELTYSVAALAAADMKEAASRTRRAEKLLGRTPLTLLLSAQIARSQGDDEKTRTLLAQMLEYRETEYLAARFLSDAAGKQQLFPKALALAQRASLLNPKGIVPLISLYVRLGEWHQAAGAIDKATRKGHLTRAEIRRYRGIIYLQEGLQLLEAGHTHGALTAAKRCLRAQPGFVPCVAFAAKAFAANAQMPKAIRLIYQAWKTQPHPLLTEALLSVIARESGEKQLKIVRKLASYHPESTESQLALGQIAIRQRDWVTARKALTGALEKEETVRTCQLLAEVEQGEYPDFDISSKWIARSAKAIADPTWVCSSCGKDTSQWEAHCHSCNNFDTLEWKRRDLAFAAAAAS